VRVTGIIARGQLNGINAQGFEFVENGSERKLREQRREDTKAHEEFSPVGILSLTPHPPQFFLEKAAKDGAPNSRKSYFTVTSALSGVFSLESPTRMTNLPGSMVHLWAASSPSS
jgi:hypothetical protein